MRIRPGTRRTAGSVAGLALAGLLAATAAGTAPAAAAPTGADGGEAIGYFSCADTERLACTDIDKVASYAAEAPAADLVVIANSTKYGGAGYSGLQAEGYPFNGVSTLASDHPSSSMIAAHEIGHSVGLLEDEYTYRS